MEPDFGDVMFWLLLIMIMVFSSGVMFQESIGLGTLNEVCRNITNEPSATYYEEIGWQAQFPCKVNNQIILIDADALKGDAS